VAVCFIAQMLAAPSAHATFPGANGKIAFTSYRDGPFVYVMNADGSGQTPLTAGTQPAWSPDGQEIAFIRHDYADGADGLYKINADGTGLVRMPRLGPAAGQPTWSPDGTKIAFVSDVFPSDGNDIWVVNSDGTDVHPLGVGVAYDPSWSPDGTKIAFVTSRNGGNHDIYTVNADGTNQTRLTTTGLWGAPDWSPDGTKIASSSDIDIYLMKADGTGITNITHSPGQDAYGGYVIYSSPVWSPDGTKIAFEHRPAGEMFDDIFVMNADGSAPVNLSHNVSIDDQPSWQPIPGPQRSDYKNAAQFCQAERDFLGDPAFARKYSMKGNPANAFGRCVSRNH
jgi:Tol biopolymer transport system component